MSRMTKFAIERVEVNPTQIGLFIQDDELRQVLFDPADAIEAAIPASDGDPEAKRVKGQKQVNGRYKRKFQDREARAQDQRVAVDVGVEGANRGFFRLMALPRAARAAGGRLRINRDKSKKGKKKT